MVLGAHFTIWFSVSFCKKEKRKKKSQYSQVTFTDLLTDLDQLLVNWRLNPFFFFKQKNCLMLFKSSSKVPTQVLKIFCLYNSFSNQQKMIPFL